MHWSFTLIDDVYENLEGYNPTKKRRVLIVFDNMTADMESNKKLSPIVNEFFFWEEENSIFHSFLYRNLISRYLKQ